MTLGDRRDRRCLDRWTRFVPDESKRRRPMGARSKSRRPHRPRGSRWWWPDCDGRRCPGIVLGATQAADISRTALRPAPTEKRLGGRRRCLRPGSSRGQMDRSHFRYCREPRLSGLTGGRNRQPAGDAVCADYKRAFDLMDAVIMETFEPVFAKFNPGKRDTAGGQPALRRLCRYEVSAARRGRCAPKSRRKPTINTTILRTSVSSDQLPRTSYSWYF